MTLPPLLVLADRGGEADGGARLLEVVRLAVGAGARAVLLREKTRPARQRAQLAGAILPLVRAAGGLLLVASDPSIESDGVHLAAADPMPVPRPPLVGRSCHDPASLAAAAAEGCDYATLSPIFATASKPGYGPALGPALLGGAPLPVYALGGVTPANAAACVGAGAAGVAVMGAVMAAADPAGQVRRLLAALGPAQ